MPLRFHESLPSLVRAATATGVVFDDETIVVRDGAGRLVLGRERVPEHARVEAALRAALGGYAGNIVLITGSTVRRLLMDPTVSEVEIDLANGQRRMVRYADRRIIGMDWLRAPAVPSGNSKRLVFGSLKGGVGRSTALAVLTADLSRSGKRVLVIDLDLEAPGVGFMLLPGSEDPSKDRRPRFGVIDYLLENGLDGIADEDLYDFVGVSPFHEGSIEVVPAAGRVTDEHPETMLAKLSRALVEDRGALGVKSVSDQVREMIERLTARAAYDAILIDARAGMAEITAAPLLGLGAELLLFGTNQTQTFRGYAYILSHLISMSDFSILTTASDWRQHLSFVQAKAPASSSNARRFVTGFMRCALPSYMTKND